jgi:hypothetical protein
MSAVHWQDVARACTTAIAESLVALEKSEAQGERFRGRIAMAREILKLASPDIEPPERTIQHATLPEFVGEDVSF